MAFLPGIFNRNPAPATAAAQPAQPAPVQTNSNGSAGPAGAQAAGPANPAANPQTMQNTTAQPAASGPVNPLDAYSNLFTPKPQDPKAQKVPTMADPILGTLDPVAFRQQVATANFASNIPQEQMQKALGGDVQAFSDVINSAAREAFAAAAQLSHGLIEQGVRTGAERLNSGLDSRIRNFQVKSQNTSNEALNHPAVAPMLNAVKMQIASSNPNLSADQVQQQAEQYFSQMAEVLVAPKQAAAAAQQKPSGMDFSSYLE
jgi:hypothetical protein